MFLLLRIKQKKFDWLGNMSVVILGLFLLIGCAARNKTDTVIDLKNNWKRFNFEFDLDFIKFSDAMAHCVYSDLSNPLVGVSAFVRYEKKQIHFYLRPFDSEKDIFVDYFNEEVMPSNAILSDGSIDVSFFSTITRGYNLLLNERDEVVSVEPECGDVYCSPEITLVIEQCYEKSLSYLEN
jgi:hypothetical protein